MTTLYERGVIGGAKRDALYKEAEKSEKDRSATGSPTRSRVLLARPLRDKTQVIVIEVTMTNDGIEIASIHKSQDRTLNKARELLRQLLGR